VRRLPSLGIRQCFRDEQVPVADIKWAIWLTFPPIVDCDTYTEP
jgi:hypothetical protein